MNPDFFLNPPFLKSWHSFQYTIHWIEHQMFPSNAKDLYVFKSKSNTQIHIFKTKREDESVTLYWLILNWEIHWGLLWMKKKPLQHVFAKCCTVQCNFSTQYACKLLSIAFYSNMQNRSLVKITKKRISKIRRVLHFDPNSTFLECKILPLRKVLLESNDRPTKFWDLH